jgi:hypothetical protein
MLIQKAKHYLVGICSITSIVGKVKKLEFDSGKEIEVNKEQLEKINKNWYEIVEGKNGK